MSRPRTTRCPKRPAPQLAVAPCAATAKRRRLAPPESPWASLNPDLLRLVAERALASDLLDYVRLRAVCAAWRSATACPRGRGITDPRFHPRRWMMFPEGHGLHPGHAKLRGFVRFFNLSTCALARAKLPLFQDHMVLDSVDGLLLLQRDHDTAIRLLHPFTGDIADLPPLETLRPQMGNTTNSVLWNYNEEKHRIGFLRDVCASVSVNDTGSITVMLAFHLFNRVAFAASGDLQWTLSKCDFGRPCWRTLSYQGKLFMVKAKHDITGNSDILQIDPPNDQDAEGSPLPEKELAPKLVATIPKDKLFGPCFLAECDSEILIIGHDSRPTSLDSQTMLLPFAYNDIGNYTHTSVYRISDLTSGRFSPVASIGDHALFIGPRTICVSSKALPTIFCGDTGGYIFHTPPTELFFTQYHLSSRTWSPLIDGSIGNSPPPRPYSLIHHILTCCYRKYWNKGLIFYRETTPSWRVKRNCRVGMENV
uniref:KIB1-4 beta-propeller domain-containing protein n=2 Tax=Oryza TaxID=4527 RepID=A0A0D9YJU4_9ORYZ